MGQTTRDPNVTLGAWLRTPWLCGVVLVFLVVVLDLFSGPVWAAVAQGPVSQ